MADLRDRFDDDAYDEPADRVDVRVRSLVYAGVAYAYGSRYPLPAHDDWDDDEMGDET